MTVDLEAVEKAAASVSARFAQPAPVGSDEMAHDEAARLAAFAVPAMVDEIRRLRAMTSCTMGVGRGDGKLFVHGDYESVRAAQEFVFTVERVRALLDEWSGKIRVVDNDGGDNGVRDGVLTTLQWCLGRLTAALNGRDGGR